jgi:Zn-dependent protease
MEHLIQIITVYAIPVIFAITLHEAAHGYVARHFGDNTAYAMGRVSLNPLRHVDPMGTIVVPLMILLISSAAGARMLFGWAKPVPVNFANLRHPKNDMLWVALAGPAMNFFQMLLWALFLKLQLVAGVQEQFFLAMASVGIGINMSLMLLNLLPIPPLDGGRIVVSLLPQKAAWRFAQLERYGLLILIVLIALNSQFGVLTRILTPFYRLLVSMLEFVFGLNLS